ncbi:GNAT family N-acetyltransferase [Silvibacterium dinghuense]|uniref:GNAT family N-acetyltransferase n=1 Tax=Silvibacterium dinghuense TaxID=1560006 RepID=A0A4Q1SFM7_9BACT|nr:GNAT family N-acetyltransferase [Silvibacterium dinghuense]RXS96401.1 GNAT family N-acetyltransferase [Silvibacterium dinghuense]GGG90484.1 acetyltransferase [Silvibacterium dinghuense]
MEKKSDKGFAIRVATEADAPALKALIEASVHGLQAGDYSQAQRDAAVGVHLGVDSQLIADRTYFVVSPQAQPEVMAACGGWSRRQTLFGADRRPDRDASLLDPAVDAARIRAFFVHPDWARQGIGSLLLQYCEDAARAEGFRRFEMGATLTGVPLYRRWGYEETGRIELELGDGLTLPIVRMGKTDRE